MKVFSPKFGIFGQTSSDEKIYDNFSTVKIVGFATAPITITCPPATTPQPVNRIESNPICYQPNRPPLLLHSIERHKTKREFTG